MLPNFFFLLSETERHLQSDVRKEGTFTFIKIYPFNFYFYFLVKL